MKLGLYLETQLFMPVKDAWNRNTAYWRDERDSQMTGAVRPIKYNSRMKGVLLAGSLSLASVVSLAGVRSISL